MNKKTLFRLVLVEWHDNYNTDSYYLTDLIKSHNFLKENTAKMWINKHIEKIKKLVDTDYTTDLYIEEWQGEWCINTQLITNLYTKE